LRHGTDAGSFTGPVTGTDCKPNAESCHSPNAVTNHTANTLLADGQSNCVTNRKAKHDGIACSQW
jgi:hypothetical protein